MLLDYETMAMWNYKQSEKKHMLVCQDAEKEFGVDELSIYRGDDSVDFKNHFNDKQINSGIDINLGE